MQTSMRHDLRAYVPTSCCFGNGLCTTFTERRAFQNSPFMQGVRKTEAAANLADSASSEAMFGEQDLCWTFTCDRDEKRKKPTHRSSLWTARWGRLMRVFCMTEGCILCHSSLQDDDFSAPKHTSLTDAPRCIWFGNSHVYGITATPAHSARQVCCQVSTTTRRVTISKCSDMSRTTTRSEVLGIDEFATLEEVKKAQMFCWKEKEDLCVCFFAGLQEALARVPSRQNLWPEHGTERGVP